MPKNISLIFAYYRQPMMLRKQLEVWKTYPSNVEIILIDDASSVHERAEKVIQDYGAPTNCEFQLFRILVDLPWNQGEARNIGAKYATHDWIMLMDIDHVLSAESLSELQNTNLDENIIYSFKRKLAISGEEKTPHLETRILNKDTYWDIGGYDESFAGIYGAILKGLVENFKKRKQEQLPVYLELFTHNDITDARCPQERKSTDENLEYERRIEKIALIEKWKREHDVGAMYFRFPWVKLI